MKKYRNFGGTILKLDGVVTAWKGHYSNMLGQVGDYYITVKYENGKEQDLEFASKVRRDRAFDELEAALNGEEEP